MKRRILIVDDDAIVRSALARLLGRRYQVDLAENGARALETASREHDAVLCDLVMPEMDGLEFARALESCAPEIARRIIFMSGGVRGTPPSSDRPILEKPFALDAFEAALAALDAPG
jgi:CheY-like chemotaxis protein